MSPFKALWGLLMRVLPCPTRPGLRTIGRPHDKSPVLVTCNFHTTVARLTRYLSGRGVDAWLLVVDSGGVNVWCAAGGDELSTDAVVAAVKTSEVADRVTHRTLVLPPLGAPGIDGAAVARRTGWKTRWGPVRYHDLPAYLAADMRRTEPMGRVTYGWRERLDTALGSLFPFYGAGGLGFALFGPGLLPTYLAVGALTFAVFFLAIPWLPGRRGLIKVLPLLAVVLTALGLSYTDTDIGAALLPGRAALIIAAVTLAVWAGELGGLASTLPSDLDPLLAKLGIGAIGNTAFAGTLRTELLNGDRRLTHDAARCSRCGTCVKLCPQGVWAFDDQRIHPRELQRCTACRACLTNCPTDAIKAVGQPPDSQ